MFGDFKIKAGSNFIFIPPYNAATQTWINRVVNVEGGTVESYEADAVNTFTNSVLIGEFDRFWVHGLQNPIAARTSIANAATSDLITNVAGATFTAGQGFTPNGTTSFLNTNYNPSVEGIKYTLNSASFGFYSRTNVGNLSRSGGGSGSNLCSITANLFGIFIHNVNSATSPIVGGASNSLGFYSAVRTNSLTTALFKNGSSVGGATSGPSTGVPDRDFFIGAFNNAGTAVDFDTRQIAISFAGSGTINQSDFYTTVQNLATTLGFNV
jgi:hypothetical protein